MATHRDPTIPIGPRRTGVISNPLSGGNRRGMDDLRRLLSGRPHVLHREVRDEEGVRDALADFAGRGVNLVAVNSGDGTVQAVATALLAEAIYPAPPLLALLRGGTTNMTHQDLGLPGPPARALARLIAWADHGEGAAGIRFRTVLRVENPLDPRPRFGFFLGAACIHRGIRFFHAHIRTRGLTGDPAHLLILLRFLAALLRRDDRLAAPVAAGIRLDRKPLPSPAEYLLILVTTLDRLILGFRPFWRAGDQPLRLTAVRRRPRRLHRAAPALVRGRDVSAASPENGYFSGSGRRIELGLDGGYALDGELYNACARRGPVVIRDGGRLAFVRL